MRKLKSIVLGIFSDDEPKIISQKKNVALVKRQVELSEIDSEMLDLIKNFLNNRNVIEETKTPQSLNKNLQKNVKKFVSLENIEDELISISETQKLTKIPPKTLKELYSTGEILSQKVGKKTMLQVKSVNYFIKLYNNNINV